MNSECRRHYSLICSLCGRRQDDDGFILECPAEHPPALFQTRYASVEFHTKSDSEGLFRYRDWLPVIRVYKDVGRTVVYRSRGLAGTLGLPNLWIGFNGYWPERGADLQTATFKEFEAYTVLGRMPGDPVVLTVGSSGNTGAAFAWACSEQRVPCLLVVPEQGLHRLRFRGPLDPCVSLVVIHDGDYTDAMNLAATVSRLPSFQPEGGVKNVGRRDGLAVVMLSAFEKMGRLPTHYFQAVGSGTGAIAALEAAKRVRGAVDDQPLPKLMVCQNVPFAPIYEAWQMGLQAVSEGMAYRFRQAITHIYADELANSTPPYGIVGGIHDALVESQGDVLVADNASVRAAMSLFEELEGIDIEPAAGVAVACLRDAAVQGKIGRESVVLLNVTGGGRLRLDADYPLVQAQPRLRVAMSALGSRDVVDRIAGLSTV
jgi:cysteate synthase